MVPSNTISGFRTCGVYPLNPMAVLDYDPCTNSTEDTTDASLNQNKDITFTKEQEACFATRYEEGYDLYDDDYASWLAINHPEAVANLRCDLNTLTSDKEIMYIFYFVYNTGFHETNMHVHFVLLDILTSLYTY